MKNARFYCIVNVMHFWLNGLFLRDEHWDFLKEGVNTDLIVPMSPINSIDYRCDNRRFWLSAHNCQVPTPTSKNLEFEQQIRIFGAD